jgi:hypothetical protein
MRRREETIEVGSYAGLPGLVHSSHDGASVVSSSMPGTPSSTVHFEIREPQPKGHHRSGSGGSNKRYSKIYLEPAAARRRPSTQGPRPVISQPAPPPRPERVALPYTIRTPRRPHSDSDWEPLMSGALPPPSSTSPQRDGSTGTASTTIELTDRGRAREEFRRQERERRRREEEQRLLRLQEERDRALQSAAAPAATPSRDERERRERALDEHERRTQAYMRAREEMREEDRRRRNEQETARRAQLEHEAEQVERIRRRVHDEQVENERLDRERRRRSDDAAAAAAVAAMVAEEEEEKERRRRAAEERAARDVDRERLERELQHMMRLEARIEQREREAARIEAAARRALELQAELARLEARERELREEERERVREREERRAAAREARDLEERQRRDREEHEHREMQRREREAADMRRAAADRDRLERRAREAHQHQREQLREEEERRRLRRRDPFYLDGPRFGERQGITAGPSYAAVGGAGANTLDSYIGRLSPGSIDDPERRRARGEAVLMRERLRYAESDTEGYASLGRRNTIGGGGRGRETRYRDNRRRYF